MKRTQTVESTTSALNRPTLDIRPTDAVLLLQHFLFVLLYYQLHLTTTLWVDTIFWEPQIGLWYLYDDKRDFAGGMGCGGKQVTQKTGSCTKAIPPLR